MLFHRCISRKLDWSWSSWDSDTPIWNADIPSFSLAHGATAHAPFFHCCCWPHHCHHHQHLRLRTSCSGAAAWVSQLKINSSNFLKIREHKSYWVISTVTPLIVAQKPGLGYRSQSSYSIIYLLTYFFSYLFERLQEKESFHLLVHSWNADSGSLDLA